MVKLSSSEEDRVQTLHEKLYVVDSLGAMPFVLNDAMSKAIDDFIEQDMPSWQLFDELDKIELRELATDRDYLDTYINRFKQSGLTGISITIGSPGPIPFTYEGSLTGYAQLVHKLDLLDEVLQKATRVEHIRQAKKDGKVALLTNFQGTQHIGADLDKLDFFYKLGVRQVQLTYNTKNLVGDGCTERGDGGLSMFGEHVVERLNQLHSLVDVSHAGEKTAMDAIEVSRDPVIVSHTNCRSLSDNSRCMNDEVFQAIAEKGGYIGLTVIAPFINVEKVKRTEKVTLRDWLAHVDHLVNLVGVDNIGIGVDDPGPADIPDKLLDFSNKELYRIGFKPEDYAEYGPVTEGMDHFIDIYSMMTRGLVMGGYSDQEIAKIMGENYLACFKRVVG